MFFRKRREQQSALQNCVQSAASESAGSERQNNQAVQSPPVKCMVYGQIDAQSPFSFGINPYSKSALERLRGLRILLAEDHEVNASLLIEELGHFGAQVEHALDGEATCQILMSGTKFDVVLMDCQMPKVDGFEAARRIRTWETKHAHPEVPIIALTGLSQEFEQTHSTEVGMNGYLVKPFSALQLATSIHSAMHVTARSQPLPLKRSSVDLTHER